MFYLYNWTAPPNNPHSAGSEGVLSFHIVCQCVSLTVSNVFTHPHIKWAIMDGFVIIRCLKVPKEVYTDDFRNEVEVPRSIMEPGARTQKMLHWKEGVATERV